MPFKDPKKQRDYYREYKERTKEEKHAIRLEIQRRHRAKIKSDPEWYARELEKNRIRMRILGLKRKAMVLEHYSAGDPVCACCGEKEFGFLTVDHVNGGGTAQRSETGGGWSFYRWLIKNDFPDGYQILCYNCNCGRAANNGICPHKEVNNESKNA